jgi:ABC-type multidrug transport system fused ATPase/permease subunit
MANLSLIKTVIKTHRWRLLLTYCLFTLEMSGALLRPFFLGKAIDGLIYGNNVGLYQLIIVHFAWVVIGIIRQRFDTRTYSAIYASLVTKFITKKALDTDVSKLAAHSTLTREFVDFLEFDLVYVFEAAFNIIGSLFLLCLYDAKIVSICLAILIPVSAVSFFYGRKMRKLNTAKNDEIEKQVDIISTGNPHQINRHYTKLRLWQIKISDQEAWNFGIMEIMVIIVIAASLYVTSWNTSHQEEVLAGTLVGVYNYVLKFVSGLDTIPYTLQRLSNLQDISSRITLEKIDEEEKV